MRVSTKKLQAIILASIVCIILFSCNDDDKPNPLKGSWTLKHLTAVNCDDPDDNDDFSTSCTAENCFTLTFKANKTYSTLSIIDYQEAEGESGSYSFSGSTLTLCPLKNCANSEELEFSIDGSELTLSSDEADELGCLITLVLEKE